MDQFEGEEGVTLDDGEKNEEVKEGLLSKLPGTELGESVKGKKKKQEGMVL